jgi:hypothetical protein
MSILTSEIRTAKIRDLEAGADKHLRIRLGITRLLYNRNWRLYLTNSDINIEGRASVSSPGFQRDNHYVPRLYLKRWADADLKVNTYRILVSHQNMPLWKKQSIKGLAHHKHLYTRVAAAGATDEFEKWLATEFEDPAEEPLRRAISGSRLSKQDWECLIRFAAAQDVRTPARMLEILRRCNDGSMDRYLQESLKESVRVLTEAHREGKPVHREPTPHAEHFPARVTTEIEPGAEQGIIRVEMIAGRAYWLFSMRRLLTQTVEALLQHHWTIVRAPKHMRWLTSDDPFIKLNFYDPGYDFKGGWGSKGTDLFLPLDPEHMLFTTVGKRPVWGRDCRVPEDIALRFQQFTIGHAHRMIFATHNDPLVFQIRPRYVDADAYVHERKEWDKWNDEQGEAERALYRR